jgi:hypothetical protein
MSNTNNKKSLWQMVEIRCQPEVQYMDNHTLENIKANQPKFKFWKNTPLLKYVQKIDINLISNSTPRADWYFISSIQRSIHGDAHAVRVMVYVYLLSLLNNLTDNDLSKLLLSASLHDIRRKNDRGDIGHAKRCIDWLTNNSLVIGNDELRTGVINIISGADSRLGTFLELADALDRFRLPKVKWWINDKYFDVIPPSELKSFAFDLTVMSELEILKGTEPVEAVLNSLANMRMD